MNYTTQLSNRSFNVNLKSSPNGRGKTTVIKLEDAIKICKELEMQTDESEVNVKQLVDNIPKQYKATLDKAVLAIADEVRKIDFIIEELGERLEFIVDEHIFIIKKKGKDEKDKLPGFYDVLGIFKN